jgi:hypothetical protein
MQLVPPLMKNLFLLFQIAVVLCVKTSFAQGGPAGGPGGGTSGSSYPCLSKVTITNGYQCANNEGVSYNYPQVYKTHQDEFNNTVVDYQDPMAAKIGTTLSVTLNVTRSTLTQYNYSGTLNITAQYFHLGGMISVPCTSITPIYNLMPGQSTNVTFSLGSLPNFVTKGTLVINFNGDGHIDGKYEEQLYLIYDQPKTPQIIPWIGVLEDSCTWASGKNSITDVKNSLTIGLNAGHVFFYQGLQKYSVQPSSNTAYSQFKLAQFLQDSPLRPSRNLRGNCYDVSNYLAICFSATGAEIGKVHLRKKYSGNFATGYLTPIVRESFISDSWNNHQMTKTSQSDSVYDSCLILSTQPDGTQPGIVAQNWNIDWYWQQPFNNLYLGVHRHPAPYDAMDFFNDPQPVSII